MIRSHSKILRYAAIAWSLAIFESMLISAHAHADHPGIFNKQPASGRFVQFDEKYLVPFTQQIPGTDVSFEMIPVPAGKFLLGSPATEPGRKDDEGPQVEIKLLPFWIGRTEVTWAEYRQYMALCTTFEKFDDLKLRQLTEDNDIDAVTAPSKLYDPSFTYAAGQGDRQPAVSMSQYAAKQYTKWLSLLTGRFFRLPTEAEWEYACRAGSKTTYCFGNDPAQLDDYAWHYENADDKTHNVGSKRPNAWELHDMHGNASEWVLDQHEADWYRQLAARKTGTAARDAICWPTKLFPRVLRGGSWNLDPPDCRSAARRQSHDDDWRSYDPNSPKSPWWFASDASQDVGFRIVCPYEIPPRAERARCWDADLKKIQAVADQRIDKEGRGKRGLVNKKLADAIRELRD